MKSPGIAKAILRKGAQLKASSSWFWNYAQSHKLEQYASSTKQTHKSIQQNRDPRNKPTVIWLVSLTKELRNIH